ncbi:uncharacterized protein LOC117643600 isoform X2 [Thrips palmi]|nr:uncharacterized protein LOC117643600 isoform X2 [Thrips palmi]XP_034238464.1 uncharacterized protein LOC117643600 isoform X2 [Thrips palmi]XP_034238465.1 uncharacterized protein LOC117643600 isoform X2 [Thrips palmi]
MDSILRHNHSRKIPVLEFNSTFHNGMFLRGESKITVDCAKWDPVSGWREHFLVLPLGELCFVFDEILADIIHDISSNGQIPTKCPIADGVYKGGTTPAELLPMRHFPLLPYGRYKAIARFLHNKPRAPTGIRGCVRAVVDVVSV